MNTHYSYYVNKIFLMICFSMIINTGQADEIEDLFWESANCSDAEEVQLYLDAYPNGAYENEALECLGSTNTMETEDAVEDSNNCIITIVNKLAQLMEEPDVFSIAIKFLEPGKYVVLDDQRVDTGVSKQSWYRIESDGRSGWVQNAPFEIKEKSSQCP